MGIRLVNKLCPLGKLFFKAIWQQNCRKSYDVSYGGENGLNQAVTQAGDALANVRFVEEKNLCSKFFTEISLDS